MDKELKELLEGLKKAIENNNDTEDKKIMDFLHEHKDFIKGLNERALCKLVAGVASIGNDGNPIETVLTLSRMTYASARALKEMTHSVKISNGGDDDDSE